MGALPTLAEGAVSLNLPVQAVPWRDMALVEEYGPRPVYGGDRRGQDPLVRETRSLKGDEIAARTGIRGADTLDLEGGMASISFPGDGRLDIPELRLATGARLPATEVVNGIRTEAQRRFIHVGQRSGGDRVGGVTLELRKDMRHPGKEVRRKA